MNTLITRNNNLHNNSGIVADQSRAVLPCFILLNCESWFDVCIYQLQVDIEKFGAILSPT